MKKVILAEDDEIIASLLKTLLSMEGFQVFAAETRPQQILQAVHENRPDVLLLDVHLTGGSGLDVVRELRAQSSNEPRVIMISGMDMREQCLQAGADAFLLKPFMPDDLLNTIRRLTS
ncbi:MAG: response regulator transcription factor [Anaerolineales bacterium]